MALAWKIRMPGPDGEVLGAWASRDVAVARAWEMTDAGGTRPEVFAEVGVEDWSELVRAAHDAIQEAEKSEKMRELGRVLSRIDGMDSL